MTGDVYKNIYGTVVVFFINKHTHQLHQEREREETILHHIKVMIMLSKNRHPIHNIMLTYTKPKSAVLHVLPNVKASFACTHYKDNEKEVFYGLSLSTPLTKSQIKKRFREANFPFTMLHTRRWEELLNEHKECRLFMMISGSELSTTNEMMMMGKINNKNTKLLHCLQNKDVKKLLEDGDVSPTLVTQLGAIYKGLQSVYSSTPPQNLLDDIIGKWPYPEQNRIRGFEKKRHLYISGDPNTGKTGLVKYFQWVWGWNIFKIPTHRPDAASNYNGEHILWIDEFNGGKQWDAQLLNVLCDDIAPFNIKHGSITFHPIRWVIITSNFGSHNFFTDASSREVLRKRFIEKDVEEVYDDFGIEYTEENRRLGHELSIKYAKSKKLEVDPEFDAQWDLISESEITELPSLHTLDMEVLFEENRCSAQGIQESVIQSCQSLALQPVLLSQPLQENEVKVSRSQSPFGDLLHTDPLPAPSIHNAMCEPPQRSPNSMLVKRKTADPEKQKISKVSKRRCQEEDDDDDDDEKESLILNDGITTDDADDNDLCRITINHLPPELSIELVNFITESFGNRKAYMTEIGIDYYDSKKVTFRIALPAKVTSKTRKRFIPLWEIQVDSLRYPQALPIGMKTPPLPNKLAAMLKKFREECLDKNDKEGL